MALASVVETEREVEELALAPWQANPYQLWSLFQMLRFYAASFSIAFGNLERCESAIALLSRTGEAVVFPSKWGETPEQQIQKCIKEAQEECNKLPVSFSLKEQLKRTFESVSVGNELERAMTLTRIVEAKKNLVNELTQHLFLCVPSERKWLFLKSGTAFGEDVPRRFPDTIRDISDAARCICLDQWTAAVFHLMRILEHGLRPIAQRFDVPFTVDSWHKVIRGIEEGVQALRNKQGLTEQDRIEITQYSEAIVQFRNFKDAWRNHVSHGRETYDEREATQVYNAVREFMVSLATEVFKDEKEI